MGELCAYVCVENCECMHTYAVLCLFLCLHQSLGIIWDGEPLALAISLSPMLNLFQSLFVFSLFPSLTIHLWTLPWAKTSL